MQRLGLRGSDLLSKSLGLAGFGDLTTGHVHSRFDGLLERMCSYRLWVVRQARGAEKARVVIALPGFCARQLILNDLVWKKRARLSPRALTAILKPDLARSQSLSEQSRYFRGL